MSIIAEDEFNPKKIYNELIERVKQVREWYVSCYIEESWVPVEPLPFDITIDDGVFTCRVLCRTYREAQTIVGNRLPVIRFIEHPEE